MLSRSWFTERLTFLHIGVRFSFIPSQAITVQQTAVYKCSVDNNGVAIQWNVNGITSTESPDHTIMTSGVDTQNSTLTIPGNPELNNTIVTCIASGLVDGMQYINSSEAILYMLNVVMSLMLQIKYDCNVNK